MDYNIKKQNPGKKLSLIYFGHGLTGYYGIQKLMMGELREKIKINLVVVSYKNPQKADCVRSIASDYGLEVCSDQINSEEFLKKIKSYSPDLGVVMNFDQKINKKIIDSIPNGIWNVHPSDLPKKRGGSPLEYIIIDGDDLRISVHKLTENFDDGDIIYKTAPIKTWGMDIDDLYFFSSRESALALEETIELYLKDQLSSYSQNHKDATYANASKLDELLRINWNIDDGEKIFRKILAGGLNKGVSTGIIIDGNEELFSITDANYIHKKTERGNECGRLRVMPDKSYSVDVIGGKLYFSKDTNKKISSKIIHTLNRANEEKVCLV